MNAKKPELTFNIFLSFISSVGGVSGSRSMTKGVISRCLFVRVMFCWAGSAWACGAVPWLGTAEAALSGLTIFYLCFSSLLFLRSRPRRQRSDQVRRRKTSTHVHS